MSIFTFNKDNATRTIYIQGAHSQNNNSDIAALVFQNYDDDTKRKYNMAAVTMIDAFGNTEGNGFGCLTLKTNQTGGDEPIEVMRLDHRGNVGIGTVTPQARLDVVGDLRVDGAIQTKFVTVLTGNPIDVMLGPMGQFQRVLRFKRQGALTLENVHLSVLSEEGAIDLRVFQGGTLLGMLHCSPNQNFEDVVVSCTDTLNPQIGERIEVYVAGAASDGQRIEVEECVSEYRVSS